MFPHKPSFANYFIPCVPTLTAAHATSGHSTHTPFRGEGTINKSFVINHVILVSHWILSAKERNLLIASEPQTVLAECLLAALYTVHVLS